MTAAEAVVAIHAAGLEVVAKDGAIQLRGEAATRRQFLPMVSAMAAQIFALVTSQEHQATCLGPHPTRVCPPCGFIHGQLVPDPCVVCHREDWTVAIQQDNGTRVCASCVRK